MMMKVVFILTVMVFTASGAKLDDLEHEHQHDFPLATGREAAEASVRMLEFFNALNDDLVQFPLDMPALKDTPVDFPFTCADKFPGYYADVDYNCQVYHVCREDPTHNIATFLCPNATVFHQEIFACDWWFNVDCAQAPNFYYLNEDLHKDPEEEENVARR